ncbi:aldehyde dehydrogenase family protein [Vreelandella neptunia]|uniref:Aldehyde dehydrogenase family protein n=1 Tax=Vreelandella neptunia TaxID=115551 RepID=A0ABZ0YNB0_9GAMM|nr:aldehyde dehydrogenase family protein [Halomonas neptunia]MDN3560350.1 aldehyde dehydrogenase family protein [Halomonas neptunia]WQH12725.1 aldehyde dehydrogenase family protein [Halomonas neptunia]
MQNNHKFHALINGELVSGTQQMPVINPSNEEFLTYCPQATPEDVERAIGAARKAWPAWRDAPMEQRRQTLHAIADCIEENAEELQRWITLEQGKPLAGAAVETSQAPAILRYFAEMDLSPRTLQDDERQRAELHRRPLGVVAAIVPWNFPLVMACYKLGPALIAGNTCLIKPSPTTPLATLRLGEMIADLVPPGVVNILPDGGDVGPLLTGHGGINKVSFTGSTATGRAVMRSAADSLQRLTLELGGNDAAIVLDDVDVDAVAPQLFALAFVNSGQVCMSIKRLYIQSGIYDRMCDALAEQARDAKLGEGLDPETQYGPVQNRQQFEAVQKLLEQAPQHGRVIAGGNTYGPGYFVEPTLIRDIEEGNPLVDEEIFGPVRSLLRFDDIDEAIARANNSPYGLGGSVWTQDLTLGKQIACRLESGSAWVNQHFAMAPHIPFGGHKQSGIGVEFAEAGLHEYTAIQSVVIAK